MYNAYVVATVFLLSPARCGGERAQLLVTSRSELGRRLHARNATLGEVMAWLSALYFRGKLAYSERFGAAPGVLPGALVMAPGQGLRPPAWPLSTRELRAMGEIDIETSAFVRPLRRDAEQIDQVYGCDARIVLLGSVATGKYVDTLLDVFGERLLFPETFVGRGDMSRGGLMLRAARSGEELAYCPVAGARRRGARPPKLPRLPRSPALAAKRGG